MHHYRHRFHPAGHGTFFTGQIDSSDAGLPGFTWIYDCGSRRRSHLRGLAEAFHKGLATPRVDLMCVSHFDSDHVSGLDVFFQAGFHVDTLALPYAPPAARLLLAAAIREEDADAQHVAAMLLDPVHYLRRRELLGRIGRIVLVRGALPEDPDASEGVRDPGDPGEPRSRDEPRLRVPDLEALGSDDAFGITAIEGMTHVAHPNQSWTVGGLYEFVFYNLPLTGRIAPRSGAGLDDVAREVRDLVDQFDLTRAVAAKPGWLRAIRHLYARHFGATPHQRNAISLCVQGRCLHRGPHETCERFTEPRRTCLLPVPDERKTGVLLTGDIPLKRKTLLALRNHLGARRWTSLAVMQVPHHGARGNWQAGNSAECDDPHYVICAPGTALHPHADVTSDLPDHVLADYRQAVAFNHHHP